MEVLRRKIDANKAALTREIDLNNDVLSYLSRAGLLDVADYVKLQVYKFALLYLFTSVYTNIPSCRRNESKAKTKLPSLQVPGPLRPRQHSS